MKKTKSYTLQDLLLMDISQIKVWTSLIVPSILIVNNSKLIEFNNILSKEEVMITTGWKILSVP